MRAWVVGHAGFGVGTAILAIGLGAAGYAYVRVPGAHGGPIPMWLLTPPALSMMAALAVHDEIPAVGFSERRMRLARLAWAIAVMALAGLSAAFVGEVADQPRMGLVTVGLTGLAFGLAVVIGRGSVAVGASLLVVIVVSTRSVSALTPAALWDGLPGGVRVGLGVALAGCVGAYAYLGPRASRAALSG